MRIRSIKPDFFKHDKICDLKPLARLLFISLWCLADRRGRMEDRPKRIKVECLPYDDCDVDELLWEIHKAGFIDRYEVDGVKIIEVSAFEKHQRISGKEADYESVFPRKQLGSSREAPGKQQGSTGEAPGSFTESQEGKGKGNRKGTGKEGVQGEEGQKSGDPAEQNGLPAIGADDQPTKIPKGAQTFIDLWNGHAEKSGLAKIKEWTPKRATRLKALAATYGKGMGEAMPLAVQECHKASWAIQNGAGVDHILVPDNFQRYLDKARTDAAVPTTAAAAPGQPTEATKPQRNTPAWVADKIKEVEAKIAAKKREKQRYEWDKREQSAKEVAQEIFELEIQLNALK